MKKYYNQIHVNKTDSIKTLDFYATNIYHPTQQDDAGKFKKGAIRLRDTHREMFSALITLLITKTIVRRNKINKYADKLAPYNITKPLELKVQPYEIKAIITRGLRNAISLQTCKNRMDRLEEIGIISRRWVRAEGVFSILFYPQFLNLKCAETENYIKTNDFSNNLKSNKYKSKNENLIDTTNSSTNSINKIIQDKPVDKRNVLPHISSSSKNEHPEKKTKTVQDDLSNENLNPNSLDIDTESTENKNIASERLASKCGNELQNYKKKAAHKFYEKFILAFWQHLASMYLIKQAPRNTLLYVEQSYETLLNDDWYFGACKNKNSVDYQLFKLLKALKSTQNFVAAKKKENPRFTLDYVYPNAFLKANPEKGQMSFKNGMLHIENYMNIHEEREMLIEKQLQKERDKKRKTRYNHIVSQIIAYIMLNSKKDTQKLLNQAGEYLREIHPELIMKLSTDFNNTYLVKQILNKHKDYDYSIINECFVNQEKIKHEIDKMLPEMQKLLNNKKLTISNKMMKYFAIRGEKMKPIPRAYNKLTLKLLNNYLTYY